MSSEMAMSEQASTEETIAPMEEQAAEAPQAEAAQEEVVQEQVDLSAQFAEIKRREREVRAEKNRLKAQMEDAKKQWIEELRQNPVKHLRDYGVTTDTLASAILGEDPSEAAPTQQAPAVDPELQKRLDELEAYKQEQVLSAFRKEVFDVVEKSPEDYELLLNSKGGRDLYWNAVTNYYQTYGEAPDYSEMARDVESALLEEGKKLLSLKKLQPAKPAEKVEKVAEEVAEKEPTTTISNKLVPDSFARRQRAEVTPVHGKTQSAKSDYYQYMEQQKQEILNKLLKG